MEDAQMEEGSFAAAMDSLSQRTLGQLLKRLRERVQLSPTDEEQFRSGWSARNWIVHEFLHNTIEDLLSPKGRLEVLRRLAEAKRTVKVTDIIANRILDQYLTKYDITVADMKRSADRMWDHLNPRPSGEPS
jgi:DNA-binding transcriptional ArsR family regulator